MLRSRIIPCLLVHNKGLVKTINFKDPKYVGDPINAVKIFNEKEVDELIVLDIDATVEKRKPNFQMIKNLATECRMPLCYGGGVRSPEDAKKIIKLGAEKVALSAAAIENPELIKTIGEEVGLQSVVIVIDVKKKGLFGKYEVYTHNGKKSTGLNPVEFAKKMETIGVGEIVINSIDQEGTMKGYDFKLFENIRNQVSVPLTIMGGAGSSEHIKEAIDKFGVIGAAAGSLFVFKGKYRAVLIQYLDKSLLLEKNKGR
ncbi:MAG: imidazole glycerol phosphate synthase subunit HisF [Flavobacteriales bacterium]|nr:imidazole glycerol phosphate synthase subunit HisF [Flavobacteriales bacterium]